ncbi:chromosome segregation DNA-binding protein [Janthinobacterium sp. 35]|jgi:ParB family chromosome partitioning protein|uniref:ParB/RepB/Spo0J family partition protein n=1 Tax=unclassified Janthinobacterium TaxID=2610881 RepID=UPI000C180D91|nr:MULTISPECIES: ParB/RepB/Spo0J family partition protein [unclassified Janthinobacterium]MBH1981327.1 ParB/RepB/Spo0J family partition protein [Burkholderiales bacterium]MBH1993666.1 ParB/RepB/Spo0J family partition protein [Burkholderiales bacterium]MBH2069126.1 ParB/RepB/Spo0J family partition protein [Burkholderiales bacterium]PIG28046.1 chromosome segregation DNA-binding protein [Janthinobacterium sp. 35]PKB22943.1 chromosome segregation DNA-binding protein [Janthinobacterium sp. 64]
MATKKLKGLGRGLDALLGGGGDFASPDTHQPSSLPVSQMQAGKYQPRTRMDEGALNELAASIKAQGLMQPILVRPIGQDTLSGLVKYEIIAGERRFRASQLAGLTEVPVLVRDVDDLAAAAMALIENIQREDLNPLEEAQGIHRLIADFSFTHEQAATALGRSRSAVSNLLRLMNLASPVQTMLMAGDIDMGHARALLAVDAASQITLANQVVAKRLSVRETEKLVTRTVEEAANPVEPRQKEKSGDIARLEEELSDALATPVVFKMGNKGRGQLVIDFADLDVLDGLLTRLRG